MTDFKSKLVFSLNLIYFSVISEITKSLRKILNYEVTFIIQLERVLMKSLFLLNKNFDNFICRCFFTQYSIV